MASAFPQFTGLRLVGAFRRAGRVGGPCRLVLFGVVWCFLSLLAGLGPVVWLSVFVWLVLLVYCLEIFQIGGEGRLWGHCVVLVEVLAGCCGSWRFAPCIAICGRFGVWLG